MNKHLGVVLFENSEMTTNAVLPLILPSNLRLHFSHPVMQILLQNHTLAAESMHALPDIEVTIVEYSEIEHNRKNGIDRGLGRVVPTVATSTVILNDNGNDNDNNKAEIDESIVPAVVAAVSKKKEKKSVETIAKEKEQMYYMVSCKDNGCGMYFQIFLMILD